jgi:hypothetical protein
MVAVALGKATKYIQTLNLAPESAKIPKAVTTF